MKESNREQLIEQGNKTRCNIYSFIVEFMTSNGYSPSIREIAKGTGIKSTATVSYQLYALEQLGMICTQKFKSRTVSLVGYEFVKKMEE